MKKQTYIIILFFFINLIQAQKKSPDYFTLKGVLKNNYKGYLYVSYDDKNDSCLVENNKFSFKGKISGNMTNVFFWLRGKPCIMKKEFFLENKNVKIDLAYYEEIQNKDTTVFFHTTSIMGTKTALIQDDYERFAASNLFAKDRDQKLYRKLNTMAAENPKNYYVGTLIEEKCWDSTLDKNQLKKIYSKLDKKNQRESTIYIIEKKLYPKNDINVNDMVYDFELPDENNIVFKTVSLKGKWYLIDFWATYCSICIATFPKLQKIHDLYKDRNFEILAVSVDKDLQQWQKFLKIYDLKWKNLIEKRGIDNSEAVKKYISFTPSNFLISPEGKIVARNISPEDLEKLLKKKLK
ncbi:TlpA disulfide reductase family protein [Flavobacterium ajazii]|uniref:TlpA disulfide reductase family protein n=1 Tax=Flavobacterium ajazii TaxID=2692318 RepID=UPI0013D7011F|nr:TlpA disulfide reductase family protein [Flavobacterium ajazii]